TARAAMRLSRSLSLSATLTRPPPVPPAPSPTRAGPVAASPAPPSSRPEVEGGAHAGLHVGIGQRPGQLVGGPPARAVAGAQPIGADVGDVGEVGGDDGIGLAAGGVLIVDEREKVVR